MAHEVGHVLGLRHNFAGSLAGTLTRTELNEWFRAYMTGQPLDAYTNKLTSNSMMEYTIFKGAVFTGWQMRTTKEPLPHDRAAIRWGYFDNAEARTNKMLFATDQDVGRYGDVRQFDYGPDPVVSAYAEMAEIIDLLPNNVIETFIRARAPRNPHDRIPLEQVNLSFTGYASQLAAQFADIISWFKADNRSLRVENQFDFIGDLNRQERLDAHWKRLNAQIDQLGGVDRAAFSIMPVDLKLDLKRDPAGVPVAQRLSATNLTARLEKLLTSPNYTNFVGLDDKKYSFTKEERALILQRGSKCFEELEKELTKQICQRLEDAPRTLGVEAAKTVGDEDIVAKLEQRITELAKLVIMARQEAATPMKPARRGQAGQGLRGSGGFQIRPGHPPCRRQDAQREDRLVQRVGRRCQDRTQQPVEERGRVGAEPRPLQGFQGRPAFPALAGVVSAAAGSPGVAAAGSQHQPARERRLASAAATVGANSLPRLRPSRRWRRRSAFRHAAVAASAASSVA